MFKENLIKYRLSKGLTQKQVAKKLGVSYRTYQAYEYGQNNPPLPILYKLQKLFKCSFDDLLK